MAPDKNTPCSRRALFPVVASALIVPRHVLGGPGYQAPSDTLRIGGVGVGGMGRRYLEACESERIVALCDVDHTFAAPVFKRYPGAKIYRDWREFYDREERNIDAVVVATPDHSHALVTLHALRRGKHVYCAKPLTRTLKEAADVRNAALEAKVATQTSVQSCASDAACTTAEVLLSGVLGPVREVHVWTDHPLYPAGQERPSGRDVPAGLDWNLWIGPAQPRPYHPLYHPWLWRAWWDFGTGTVGDMLCHALHVFFDALRLGDPVTVQASRSTMHGGLFRMEPDGREFLPPRIQTPETESYSTMAAWDFPARDTLPPLRLNWYDGGMKPHRPAELSSSIPMPGSGVLYVGDKGKLLTDYSGGKHRFLPESKFTGISAPARTLPRTTGHYREWIEAAKTGKPTSCNFDLGARMTRVALLGTLAARRAGYLIWEPAEMRFSNDPAASEWIVPHPRNGWSL